MQRLFSTFPDSWPGLGLLILRVSTALTVIYVHCGWPLIGRTDQTIHNLVVMCIGIFLFIGFCIPYVATATVIFLLIEIAISYSPRPDDLLLIAIGLCLTMIGPGAWSVDALLFGRRRIDIKPR